MMGRRRWHGGLWPGVVCLLAVTSVPAGTTANVELRILGPGGDPVAANVFLRDAAGKPVQPEGLPFWRDHFTCDGEHLLRLTPGTYRYTVERGPEWSQAEGSLEVGQSGPAAWTVRLSRLLDLSSEGWVSGETHIHRPMSEAALLMEAADLDCGQVITWWNARNPWTEASPPQSTTVQTPGGRSYSFLAGEDEREGGALLFFHLPKPLSIQGAARDYPSSLRFLRQARRQPGAWVDVEKPFWWDVPLWLASGGVDTIGIAHNHMHRAGVMNNEAWGRARPPAPYPGPHGNGHWTQEIYYRILNAGLRIPPSAGSASGVLPNPVGYNRVYAYTGGDAGLEAWGRAVRAGRSFVTNGPLLEVRVAGARPGEVFRAEQPGREVAVRVRLRGRDPIARVEIIRDGRPAATVRGWSGDGWRDLPPIRFDRSGWFLVRAIAAREDTFRFASTAPYYVEVGGEAQARDPIALGFFREWLEERRKRLRITDPAERAEVEGLFDSAVRFFRD